MTRLLMTISLCLTIWGHGLAAQSCGGTYVIVRGDSLSGIAEQHYRNAFRWTDIYNVNRSVIGPDPDRIMAGTTVYVPCLDAGSAVPTQGEPAKAAPIESLVPPQGKERSATPSSPALLLATGREFPPFSQPGDQAQGMFLEVLQAAFAAAEPAPATRIARVPWSELAGITGNDDETVVSFPWPGAACAVALPSSSCNGLLYSEPMFEFLIAIFAPADAPLPFADPKDLNGRALCRSDGLTAHMLDYGGFDWLEDEAVLLGAAAPEACFERLVAGEVDGVVVNEFTGRATVAAMGLNGVVEIVSPPLGIVSLHAAVPASDGSASETLRRINSGLGNIRANGQFQDILERHLVRVWAGF